MNEALRDEIIADITAAFRDVRRGGITLHEADVIDRCGSDSKRRAARARDTEARWQDVPEEDIQSHPSALSFLCPESFRYYLRCLHGVVPPALPHVRLDLVRFHHLRARAEHEQTGGQVEAPPVWDVLPSTGSCRSAVLRVYGRAR